MASRKASWGFFDRVAVFLFFLGIGIPLGIQLHSTLALRAGLLRRASEIQENHLPSLQPAVLTAYPLAPWRVGIQAGHWKIDELPEELWRLRSSAGAIFGVYKEVDANLEIARRVTEYLRSAGVQVDLLPATVPPGYQADAFISIHADGANRPGVRGWKISNPWRSSEASRKLLDAVAHSYPLFTGLPEDRYGTTYNMRGYYAFSPHRFRHAITSTTPAIIIETGFVTVARDRDVLFGAPDSVARGIAAGVMCYLSRHDPLDPSLLVVRTYPVMRVTGEQAELTFHPEEGAKVAGRLEGGTLVRPVHRENGWVEVIVWGNYRRFGWVRETDLEILGGSS